MPTKACKPNTPEERNKLGLGEWGVEYLEADMLEWSPCTVPANPNALQAAMKSFNAEATPIDRSVFDLISKENLFSADLVGMLANALNIRTCTNKTCCREPNADDEVETIKAETDHDEFAPYLRPYPSEHACRLNQPTKYDDFRRGSRKHDGKTYSIIWGKVKDADTWEEQAYRYSKDSWTAEDAKKHCEDHNGISFEPASEKEADDPYGLLKATEIPAPVVNVIIGNSYFVELEKLAKAVSEITGEMVKMRAAIIDELKSLPQRSGDNGEAQKSVYDIFNVKPKISG
jgi:hypothetical protein